MKKLYGLALSLLMISGMTLTGPFRRGFATATTIITTGWLLNHNASTTKDLTQWERPACPFRHITSWPQTFTNTFNSFKEMQEAKQKLVSTVAETSKTENAGHISTPSLEEEEKYDVQTPAISSDHIESDHGHDTP